MANLITFTKNTLSSYVTISFGDYAHISCCDTHHVLLSSLSIGKSDKNNVVCLMLMGEVVSIEPQMAGFNTTSELFNYIKSLK